MPWEPATAPLPALPPATSRTYRRAYLSRFSSERSHDEADATRYVTGAVYVDGDLVAASLRQSGHRGDLVRTVDPPRVDPPRSSDRLRGTWLYGGHWIGQFGHFLTETLTTLWPRPGRIAGIVFHRFIFPTSVEPWQRDLLSLAGWPADLAVEVVHRPTRVDRLVVPSRPLVLNQCSGPEAAEVWARVASGVRPLGRPVFLSRSGLTEDPRRLPGDEELDGLMADLGLEIVRPETLSLADQVAAVAQAPVVVAVSGSHLHLTAFADASTRVVEIGDLRTRAAPVPNQRVIDAARGHTTAFVPLVTANAPGEPVARDARATAAAVAALLDEAGLR